ncbi:MAG: type IV secretory system conjugative DNA transfer family protein [Bacteroidetes bacterium]|nr:type IV secretory system conjugative DNA transfer family protein [Bacteroidota bacterium]
MNLIEKIFDTTISIMEGALKLGFEMAEMVFSGIPKKKEGYKAEFASQGSLLSSRQYGFCLTGDKNLSVKNSYQNALIVGGTGVGKSSIVLIPSLFTMKGSFVIHDPSGELYNKSAGYLKEKGYLIKQLNFSNPIASSGFNPLQRANTSSEINKVSSMLVQNALGGNGNSKDPFWHNQAISLIAMLITLLKKQDKQYQNLYNLRLLLNAMGGNPKQIDKLFSKHADENLFTEYKSFLAYDEKVMSGTIASCKAALQTFSDEAIARVTSTDSIDMQEFRNKLTALYIQNSVADQKYYSTLTSIFTEQFFSHILSRFPNESENDVWFLIDECSSLILPTLPLAVANVRKHRSGIMLIVQDFAQIIHNYGRHEAEAIKSNCFAKMFFTGQSLETSRELEQTLGRFEYENKEGKKIIRELMTRDEIRTMKINRALLVCGHHSPILARLKPYYQSRLFRLYSELPPPVLPSCLSDALPALTLNDN